MPAVQETVDRVRQIDVDQYRYGFETLIESDKAPKGLSEDIVRFISAKKNEPDWMLQWRLEAYRRWLTMEEPAWARVDYPKIDYQDLYYYSAPKKKKTLTSIDEIDPEILKTYEKLGIPLREVAALEGVEPAPGEPASEGRKIAIETGWSPGDPLFDARIDGEHVVVQVDSIGTGWRLINEGGQAEALGLTPRQAELYALMPVKAAPDTSKFLLSPMPGLLASVAVAEGQDVKAGEALAVVEAMKMENVLRATRDGTIKVLHAKAGDSLRVDQKILEFA